MDNLWATDGPILAEIVRQLEVDGKTRADLDQVFGKAGVEREPGLRSIARLDGAGMIRAKSTMGGYWTVLGVTERGLRESHAWPDHAEQLAAQLIAGLAEAAENEPEPEKRSKLRKAASGMAEVGQKTLTDVIASYLAKMSGGI